MIGTVGGMVENNLVSPCSLTNADSALGEPAPPPSDDRQKRKRQEVWRRYSEFEALRIFLCTIYPHCVVPPLPEKAVSPSIQVTNICGGGVVELYCYKRILDT